MTRDELIEKLAAATGPSRVLDAEIAMVANPGCEIIPGANTLYIVHQGHKMCAEVPRFTSSIDSALTLRSAGALWWCSQNEHGGWTKLLVPKTASDGYIGAVEISASAHTVCIAIVIAALRARTP